MDFDELLLDPTFFEQWHVATDLQAQVLVMYIHCIFEARKLPTRVEIAILVALLA